MIKYPCVPAVPWVRVTVCCGVSKSNTVPVPTLPVTWSPRTLSTANDACYISATISSNLDLKCSCCHFNRNDILVKSIQLRGTSLTQLDKDISRKVFQGHHQLVARRGFIWVKDYANNFSSRSVGEVKIRLHILCHHNLHSDCKFNHVRQVILSSPLPWATLCRVGSISSCNAISFCECKMSIPYSVFHGTLHMNWKGHLCTRSTTDASFRAPLLRFILPCLTGPLQRNLVSARRTLIRTRKKCTPSGSLELLFLQLFHLINTKCLQWILWDLLPLKKLRLD